MRLDEVRRALLRELRATGNVRLFAEAQKRTAAFAAFASADALCRALADKHPETFAHRAALIAALVAEQQRAPARLWAALLTLTFLPALGKIAREYQRVDGAFQAAATAFHEAVVELSPHSECAVMRLHRETRRQMRRARRQGHREHYTDIDQVSSGDDIEVIVDEHIAATRLRTFLAQSPPEELDRLQRRRPGAIGRLRAHFEKPLREVAA